MLYENKSQLPSRFCLFLHYTAVLDYGLLIMLNVLQVSFLGDLKKFVYLRGALYFQSVAVAVTPTLVFMMSETLFLLVRHLTLCVRTRGVKNGLAEFDISGGLK